MIISKITKCQYFEAVIFCIQKICHSVTLNNIKRIRISFSKIAPIILKYKIDFLFVR